MKTHPELREGEVFLGNMHESDFRRSCYTTKRLGITAYDIHDQPVVGLYPFFVSETEYKENMRKHGYEP